MLLEVVVYVYLLRFSLLWTIATAERKIIILLLSAYIVYSIGAAPSGVPQDVTAVTLSSTAVHVTWSDVLTEQRNGVLQEYEVSYSTMEHA